MALKSTQKEIELEISRVLEDGDITAISQNSGIGYSYVDQQLNPNDTRKSYLVGALQIVCALDEKSPERGEKVWRIMARRRELSKPQSDAGSCLNRETGELNREIAEYISARIAGKPFNEQMSEFLDIKAQMVKVEKALLEEYNRLHSESPQMKSADLRVVK